jgi:hypothetical protein
MRRDFAMERTPCRGRSFKYSVKELAVGFSPMVDSEADKESEGEEAMEGAWKLGFKTLVAPIEFTLQLIGVKEVPGELDD